MRFTERREILKFQSFEVDTLIMASPIHSCNQRGASLVETALSVVLVALLTITAIRGYGAKISALVGRDLVGTLGGKVNSATAGVSTGDPPSLNNPPVVGGAPLPLTGGSSPVGGSPSMETARLR